MSDGSTKRKEKSVEVDLECLDCHARQRRKISRPDFEVLSASWRIERLCAACGGPTEWTFAEAVVEAEEQVDFWDWLATTGEFFAPDEVARPGERRKARRVDLHAPLVIRSEEGEEEVSSENISKSGLAFWSSRNYRLGEVIGITLKLPASAASQSMSAVVVRAGAPSEGKFLYGVRLT